MTATTQRAAILAWLRQGCELTPLGALERFGCARLAARIHELRGEGHAIDSIPIKGENGKRWVSYRLRVPQALVIEGDDEKLWDLAMPKATFLDHYMADLTGRWRFAEVKP